ncbi:MAG: hypothetical protein KF681_16505 [Bdellovibrionaceae bacterium]|nr:hypothetical protein [Pseudobdellovibrionaceae bacterium]
MRILRFLLTYVSVLSLLITSVPMTALGKSKYDLSPSTREFLSVMGEGKEVENLAEYYNRVGKFLPKEVAMDFTPFLENKGKLKAPHVKVDGDTVVLTQDSMTLTIKYATKSNINVVTINNRVISKKDFSTVKGLVSRIESILTEDYGARPKTAAASLFSLMIPQAQAQTDWMPLLLGGAVGAAGGYWLGGTTGALLGGVLGAAVGYFFFSGNKCSGPECCWTGGTTSTSYVVGCCADLKATKITPPTICTQATATPAQVIQYNTPASGSTLPTGTGTQR